MQSVSEMVKRSLPLGSLRCAAADGSIGLRAMPPWIAHRQRDLRARRRHNRARTHGDPLLGVAAPEWDAPGGQEATDAIQDMVLGKQVRCELTGASAFATSMA